MLLSPLGERMGEGVMQETAFALTPSPNLSPKGERNLTHECVVGFVEAQTSPLAPSKEKEVAGFLRLYRRQAPAVRKTNGCQAGRPSARNAAIVSSGER
jgi:hypothetical protein